MNGKRLTELTTESGDRFQARMFIDATYEGDLMARAGVSYAVGRESNATYGETLNGVHFDPRYRDIDADPYQAKGDPQSGLLPAVYPAPAAIGSGDRKIQAYDFRLCATAAVLALDKKTSVQDVPYWCLKCLAVA